MKTRSPHPGFTGEPLGRARHTVRAAGLVARRRRARSDAPKNRGPNAFGNNGTRVERVPTRLHVGANEPMKIRWPLWLLCAWVAASRLPAQSDIAGYDNSGLRALQENVGRWYGLEDTTTVPLDGVRKCLTNDWNIKDATFAKYVDARRSPEMERLVYGETNYYRCAWATNGYVLAVAQNQNELMELTARGDTMGRVGGTNWRASGNTIVFDDGRKNSASLLGQDRAAVASVPLRLGIAPLAVRSLHFRDEVHFVATDVFGKEMRGALILHEGQRVSGMAYETAGAVGWIYVVAFYAGESESGGNGEYPVRRWASFAVGPNQTNLMSTTVLSAIQVSADPLPDNYFEPQGWIKNELPIPVVIGHVVSNQLYVQVDGALVPAGSPMEPPGLSESRSPVVWRTLVAVTLLIPVLLWLIWLLRRHAQRAPGQERTPTIKQP